MWYYTYNNYTKFHEEGTKGHEVLKIFPNSKFNI
jgi:hypothetical protein